MHAPLREIADKSIFVDWLSTTFIYSRDFHNLELSFVTRVISPLEQVYAIYSV